MGLELGQILNGRYQIVGLLGEGGMGAVYRALDTLAEPPDAFVALKMAVINVDADSANPARIISIDRDDHATRPHGSAPSFEEQFKIEARLLHNLSHPNLPRVSNYFIENGQHFLVMDLIEGKDLYTLMEENGNRPFSERDVFTWFSQILDALEYCHQKKVLHRDIKPENIILTSTNKAYLVDFGIAYRTSEILQLVFPAATPAFSPPEQFSGITFYNERSDIYALGATLYYLLTGSEPESSRIREDGAQLISPRDYNPGLSSRVEQVILKAMNLNPNERFSNVSQMRSALGISKSESHDIFISYARTDIKKVQKICQILEQSGFTCWVAFRDVLPHSSWPNSIGNAIQNSKIFLLILTASSNLSRHVAREATLADRKGLPFFCLRCEDVEPSIGLDYYISDIQWLDALGEGDEVVMNILVDNLRNTLRDRN